LEKNIIMEGPIQEMIKDGNLTNITSYKDFQQYFAIFQEDFIRSKMIPLSRIIVTFLKGRKADFFERVLSSESEILQLLIVLSCQHLNIIDSMRFLEYILDSTDINPKIREYAEIGLMKYYARNIQKLEEIKSELNDDSLLSIIRHMNPARRDCQDFCSRIVKGTNNPRLQFHSALKTLNIPIIAKTIEKVFDDLENEGEIKECLRIIEKFSLGNMLEKVLEIYEKSDSQFIRKDCLNIFKKICSPCLTIKLIRNLKQNNILFTDNYDLKQIIEKHLNRFVLDEILGNLDHYLTKYEENDILGLLLKNRDPEYWNEIVSLLESIDISENMFSLYSLDEFMPFIDPEHLEPLYQSETNEEVRSFWIKALLLSRKRKYFEWWIENLDFEARSIPKIRLTGSHQKELLKTAILDDPDSDKKIKAMKRTYIKKDISYLSMLLDQMKSENNDEMKEILEERLNIIIL